MKKMVAIILLAIWTVTCTALAQVNPWKEIDAETMAKQTGIELLAPQSAQNVCYRILEGESLAEVQFSWRNVQYCMRIKPAEEFEDISGMYYDEWDEEENCSVRYADGIYKKVNEAEKKIEVCLWYDAAPGLMYALTAEAGEGQEADIEALANVLFEPVQGDSDGEKSEKVTALDMLDLLEKCTGNEGTAGASLKQAKAASEAIAFSVMHNVANADETDAKEAIERAAALFTEESYLEWKNVCLQADEAFSDDSAVQNLFDDAGVGEKMNELMESEETEKMWEAMKDIFSTVLEEGK